MHAQPRFASGQWRGLGVRQAVPRHGSVARFIVRNPHAASAGANGSDADLATGKTQDTVIEVKAMTTIITTRVPASAMLGPSVQHAVELASKQLGVLLLTKSVIFSEDSAHVQDWSSRVVGSKDISVIVTGAPPMDRSFSMLVGSITDTFMAGVTARLSASEQRASASEQRASASEQRASAAERREVLAWKPRVCNTAAQLLLVASGALKLRSTSTTCYKHLGAKHMGVQAMAKAIGCTPEEVMQEADRLLTCQSASIYPASLMTLDEEIEDVLECIQSLPALELACVWECRFLKSYPEIKAAFPHNF